MEINTIITDFDTLYIDPDIMLNQNTSGYKLLLDFRGNWDECKIIQAAFWPKNKDVIYRYSEDNIVSVPVSALTAPGKLRIGVCGYTNENDKYPSHNTSFFIIPVLPAPGYVIEDNYGKNIDNPILVRTEDEMNDILLDPSKMGMFIKFIGKSDTYVKDEIYRVLNDGDPSSYTPLGE